MSRGPRPISGGMSRAEARQLIARELAAAGIDGAEGDADHLVAGILGLAWIDLVARGEEPVGALADRLVA
ncbi:MAG TPA: hypothetical protein PK264_04780, partial [Hyphomicrobiaceae bacterium]|nr:hypothetical protein [Hyphomicrobiaceae bacterium]